MEKSRKSILLILTILITSTLLSGCSLFKRDMGRADSYEVTIVEDEKNLEDNAYYVKKKDGTFHKLHIGNTNFNKTVGEANPARVAWFGKDFDKIPTMYKGESIVYHTTAPFEEGIEIERFSDTGFTIGLAGLQESKTGRFWLSTNPDDFNMDINSSAGQLYELGNQKAIVDSIGNAKLRNGNISPSGTIMGLEEGKTYSTYVYVGTQANHYNIVADVRALVSSENTTLFDYEFNKNKIMEFNFPPAFNSGYYFVNGYGMVRYVNGTKEWTEKMDMNVPNDYTQLDKEANTEEHVEKPEEQLEAQTVENVPVNISANGKYKIEISYEIVKDMQTPTAKIVGPNGAVTLKPVGNDILAIQAELEAGSYNLQLVGLDGRSYTYRIINAETSNVESENKNVKSKPKETKPQDKKEEPNQKEAKPQKQETKGGESAADKVKKALEGSGN